ncbi:hypothetical protein CLOP_g4476 [Closterium sp. NIES-67]|nr:hypothetical protein CLOP_g4476 [Closterium sp. NIES-67]
MTVAWRLAVTARCVVTWRPVSSLLRPRSPTFLVACLLLCALTAPFASSPASATGTPSPDADVLLRVRATLQLSQELALPSWSDATSPCDGGWEADVRCDPDTNQVIHLDVSNLQLSGPIPGAELAQLAYLTYLALDGNRFSGSLPADLSRLSALKHLSMEGNAVEGPIPDDVLHSLTALTLLNLKMNNFSGQLPESVGTLTNLVALNLGANQLAGEIPASYSALSQMVYFKASRNKLDGSIPDWLASWPRLMDLELFKNGFTGSIPGSLGNVQSLVALSLDENALSGSLPESLGSLPRLEALYVVSNNLEGPIPDSFRGMQSLKYIDLSFNLQLSGPLPDFLGSMPALESVAFESCGFSGPIPPSLASLPHLKELFLDHNSLQGALPPSLASLSALTALYLNSNQLSGEIPEDLCGLQSLGVLMLGHNDLEGSIPACLLALPSITSLDVSSNRLSGALPPVPPASDIDFRANGNCLEGAPQQLSPCPTGSRSSSTPSSPSSPSSTPSTGSEGSSSSGGSTGGSTGAGSTGTGGSGTTLDSIWNAPPSLEEGAWPGRGSSSSGGSTSSTSSSSSGSSSSSSSGASWSDIWSSSPSLEEGAWPVDQQLQRDDQRNGGAGAGAGKGEQQGLPAQQQQSLPASPVQRQEPPPVEPPPVQPPPAQPPPVEAAPQATYYGVSAMAAADQGSSTDSANPSASSGGWSWLQFLLLALGVASAIAIAAACFGYITQRRPPSSSSTSFAAVAPPLNLPPPRVEELPVTEYGLSKIKRATKNLTTLYGKGSFGAVYLAEHFLPDHANPHVIIKRAHDPEKMTEQQFKEKVDELARPRHRCLVALVGYCMGKTERMLVFEYMPYGTLFDRLHRSNLDPMPWDARVRVAVNVASALAYLHHGIDPPLTHRAVTSSNVLLGADMTAKLSDYGLARGSASQAADDLARRRRAHRSSRSRGTSIGSMGQLEGMRGGGSSDSFGSSVGAPSFGSGRRGDGGSGRELQPVLSRESTPELSRENTPDLVRESAPTLSREDTPELSRENTPEFSRENTPVYSRENTPILSRENTLSALDERKADVYGFGVVLLELITGQKAMQDVHITNLAAPFLEDDQMMPLMADSALAGYFNQDELVALATIARDCVHQAPSQRPSMLDVLRALEDAVDEDLFDPLQGPTSRLLSPSSTASGATGDRYTALANDGAFDDAGGVGGVGGMGGGGGGGGGGGAWKASAGSSIMDVISASFRRRGGGEKGAGRRGDGAQRGPGQGPPSPNRSGRSDGMDVESSSLLYITPKGH